MERKTFSKVQIYVRDSYDRAAKLFAGGDIDGAIRLLVQVVRLNPEVPMLYERLRQYEIAKCRIQNGLVKFFFLLLSIFKLIPIKIVALFDPVRAMGMCEGPLMHNVDNPMILNALAGAAESCEAPWAAATALNVIREFHPGNTANLRRLATAMQGNGQAREALKIHQVLAKNAPGDLNVQNDLRSAMALASIERGRWEEEGETQKKAADAQDAVLQQILEGTIHDAEQAQVVIDRFTRDLKTNDSVDIRRKLADAYMVAEDYESALREYRLVAEKLGVPDPVLDKQIEKAYVAQIDQALEELRRNPSAYDNAEEQASQLAAERDSYRMRHALNRARTFPNDMQMQFDLAELYFERGGIDEAKNLFHSIAQNPQKRRASLVYIGRCELLSGNPEAAIEPIESALKEMFRMDKYKREALYYLGTACEAVGRKERALECYSQIVASIPDYRDVPARMAALTGTPAAEAAAGDNTEGKQG